MPAPTRIGAPHDASRERLIAHVARHLEGEGWPRLLLAAILVAAGLAAFGTAVLLLWSGYEPFEPMAIRYPLSALAGYATFLLLIRSWIAARRGSSLDLDWIEYAVPDVPTQSGGARSSHSSLESSLTDGWSFDLDGDAVAWIVVVGLCAAGALIAAVYAVYVAPVLLAEIAIDAAIVSTVYQRLSAEDSRHWLSTAIERTWIGAAVIVLTAAAAGYGFDIFVPEARSIGGVIRTVFG
jgi:hypothetical protein